MGTVELRAFAAARATLGWSHRSQPFDDGATVADLLAHLAAEEPAAAPVLERCAVLLNGARIAVPGDVAVPDRGALDLLPPFAGG